MKVTSLADLKLVKKQIEAQAQREAAEAAQRALEAKRQAAQRNLFQAAVGAVNVLPDKRRAHLLPTPPAPIPKQKQADEAAALQEAISDEVDVSSLLDTDERLSFLRPGIGPEFQRRRHHGDLHCDRCLRPDGHLYFPGYGRQRADFLGK